MSLSDIRVVLRHWFRYYQQLEKQGLTTESDRELVGELRFIYLWICIAYSDKNTFNILLYTSWHLLSLGFKRKVILYYCQHCHESPANGIHYHFHKYSQDPSLQALLDLYINDTWYNTE